MADELFVVRRGGAEHALEMADRRLERAVVRRIKLEVERRSRHGSGEGRRRAAEEGQELLAHGGLVLEADRGGDFGEYHA